MGSSEVRCLAWADAGASRSGRHFTAITPQVAARRRGSSEEAMVPPGCLLGGSAGNGWGMRGGGTVLHQCSVVDRESEWLRGRKRGGGGPPHTARVSSVTSL